MDIVKYLRSNQEGWHDPDIVWVQVGAARVKEAADEIERLRGLVHHAFCEGQITRVQWDDWKNSEVYAALKKGE